MEIELDRIQGIKDGREQFLVYQFTREETDGVFYGCKLNYDGLTKFYPSDVSGAIVAIIEAYSNLLPESEQIEFEEAITKNLLEMIDTRHEYIVTLEKDV